MTEWSVRSATEADRAAMTQLLATCYGSYPLAEEQAAWQTMVPEDAEVVVCDGAQIVGVASYVDLAMTVPGSAIRRVAGLTGLAVAPTHRRRGIMSALFTELHRRIAEAGYPVAALVASEGGIYGRFGYGPATVVSSMVVDRRFARFHADVPDVGGVICVQPDKFRSQIVDIYDRWRRRTPGGLAWPDVLWDDLFGDRDDDRGGGSAWFTLLHADGFALYRVHDGDSMVVDVEVFAAVTPEAHAALWRALVGLDLMEQVKIDTHGADPLPYLLVDARQAKTTSRTDALWLRLMDVPSALAARNYLYDVTAVLDVNDGFRSDGGRFALRIRDGVASCETTEAPADVVLGLDALGSVYLGAHSVSALATAGRVHCGDRRLLLDLDAAFRSEVPAELGYRF